MQKHLPPRPRFADRYHTWAIRHGFPILAWLAPRLDRRLERFLARGVIWAIFVVYPKSKRMLARNYAHIAGVPEGTSWVVSGTRLPMARSVSRTPSPEMLRQIGNNSRISSVIAGLEKSCI